MRNRKTVRVLNAGLSSPNNMQTDSKNCKVEPFNKDRFGCMKCPNMKKVLSDWDGEWYNCEVCGESYELDYEEMK